tara:strand:+ start:848 stop:1402 length:555 start_codon:yes stop_codon:yes gene_type:complete
MTQVASSDDDLMARLSDSPRAAQEAAFRELVSRHSRGLRSFVAPLVGSRADDVVQETFLRIYQHKSRYRQAPTSFRSWAYRIARNLALNSQRKEGRIRPLEAASPPLDPSRAPSSGLDDQERREELRSALAGLAGKEREVVELRYQRGLSYAEIAEVVGASPAAVKQRAWRALQRLRGELQESV